MDEFEQSARQQAGPLPPTSSLERRYFERCLPELMQLEQLIETHSDHLQVDTLAVLDYHQRPYPIYALSLGSCQADSPVVAFVGGVHGVERIGTQLLLAFISSLLARLSWDQGLCQELQQVRLLFCPLLNPVGMALGRRSNGNGVDLMRNAPQDAVHATTWLVGGQRLSSLLPWYRGRSDRPMQQEAQALCDWVAAQLFAAPFSLVLDCHSGFGLQDRLWFPYAGSMAPFLQRAEIAALMAMFDAAYPHHTYVIEPQHHNYLTHGDLWDYLCQRATRSPQAVFLPLTLELGSWRWVKKNPLQLATFSGLFNPTVPHRHKRALRRHLLLLEFLVRATRSYGAWLPDSQTRAAHELEARRRWYDAPD